MKPKPLLLLLILWCLFGGLPVSSVVAQEDTTELTLDWPCYVTTRITFNYPYTHEHSISNITTIGQSVYKHTGGPDFLSFIAEDIDVYSFAVTLTYDSNVTDRTILIGLWSGTEQMRGFNVKISSQTCIIHVRLEVTDQPTYPTESEVAHEVVRQIEQKIVDLLEQNRQLAEQVQITSLTSAVFGVIAAATSIVAVLLASFAFRRRSELAAD